MKLVVQRVKESSVKVDGEVVGKINKGFMVLVGIKQGDTKKEADFLVNKLLNLRIFEDENEKMNKSLIDINGEMLIVSQFTLCGDCKKGTRPSFDKSEKPELANKLYEEFVTLVKGLNVNVGTGKFVSMMEISLLNDGPVTFMLEK